MDEEIDFEKRRGEAGVKQWVATQSVADIAITVVTVIETEILRKGRVRVEYLIPWSDT